MLEPIPKQLPAREGYVTVDGMRLWYWDTGGTGEPLILCHPGSQSSQIWLYQPPVFAASGFRVIAYSRRGHYRSDRGPENDCGTLVGDLAGMLDALQVAKAHVLGAAAGGIVAMGLAIAHTARVMSLILAGTFVAPGEGEWRVVYLWSGRAPVGLAVAPRLCCLWSFC